MWIPSSISKLPRWTIPVVATSLLLFALSMGIVHFERSGPGADVGLERVASEAGRPSGAPGAGLLPGDDPAAAASPDDLHPEWSESLVDDSGSFSWIEDEQWDTQPEAGGPTSLDCVIEPHRIVSIRSSVIGMIEEIHFERSDLVEEGAVLVELESGAERATVDLADLRAKVNADLKSRQAALELKKRRSDRAARLYASNALSLDLRDEIATEADLARFELEQAADENRLAKLEYQQVLERLKRRTIRSPISGVVIERMMSPGEVVDDEVILRLAQLDPLRVEVVLPAASFGSVHAGMKAAVIPEIPGDQVQMGKVTIVDRVIDAASGTFGARLELPNPDVSIPSGLHCQVRFLEE